MTEEDIKRFLAERFSTRYAFFEEFMPFTGYAGTVNRIDALAVGLYDKDDRVIAFEIKVSKGDFKNDVARFTNKHRFALEISHEFYYVTPWALVEKSEVPEIAGLMYIDKGHNVKVAKQATRRELEEMPMKYFQAFARNFGAKIEHAKVPVKFLGKDLTQEEFKKMIEDETRRKHDYFIKRDAEELYQKRIENEHAIIKMFDEIVHEAYGYTPSRKLTTDEEKFETVKKYLQDGRLYRRARQEVRQVIDNLCSLFNLNKRN